jgi:DNA (cytosine-5)-methyltransferase 1
MKILNLYAGIGGNRKLWGDEHEITAIENEAKIAAIYKANFPNDTIIVGDAMEYLKMYRNEFDFIWASPPCQKHSKMMKATRHDVADFIDLQLYQIIIFLQHFYKGKWIVENVKPYYEPLIKPTKVFGRHLAWSNIKLTDFETENIPNFINGDSPKEIEALKKWVGIHYEGNVYYGKNHSPGQVLRNCVYPKLGLHILNCALGTFVEKHNQLSLFKNIYYEQTI